MAILVTFQNRDNCNAEWCHFLNLKCFLSSFSHKTFCVCLGSFFVLFLILEIQLQGRLVLTILPYYSPCKMADFATFQKRVIFRILSLYLSVFCLE